MEIFEQMQEISKQAEKDRQLEEQRKRDDRQFEQILETQRQESKAKWKAVLFIFALIIAVGVIGNMIVGDSKSSTPGTSSSYSSGSNKSNKSDGYAYSVASVESMVGNYCNDLVEAINSGSFSKVEDRLDCDYPLYSQQRNLVERLYGKSTKEEFITGNVESKYNANKDVIVADVYEKHLVKYSSGKMRYVDEFWVYTLAPYKPYKLRTIAKGNNPYTNSNAITATCVSDKAYIYVNPERSDSAFGQTQRNDTVKVFRYKDKEISGRIWMWVKHPYFGYGWMRSEELSY